MVRGEEGKAIPLRVGPHAFSFNTNCSAGVKMYVRIITVLSSDVSPDDARIIAITTN